MKIALLGFSHESNTFSAELADLARWERSGILEGQAIRDEYATAQATVSGFLDIAEQDPDVEVVPLVISRVTPMGPITREAFEMLSSRMLTALEDQGPWDAVLLAQHGAAVSEEFPDADGEFTRRVRELVGPDVTIGITLDMHANVSPLLVDNVDILTVYQTNPHLDPRPRALHAAELVVRTVRGEIQPVIALEMPPMAVNILCQGTDDSPMKELLEVAAEQTARPGVLSVSVVEGYPYADVAEMGMSYVAITDDDAALAQDIVTTLARSAWEARNAYDANGLSIDDALRRADASERRPVVLLDTGDNVGGGSPADSTHVLAAAQRLGVRDLFHSLCDPAAVQDCVDAGVGATVHLKVGAKTDNMHGSAVAVSGRVKLLHDGVWEDPGDTHGGFRFFDTGTGALIETDDGHHLLLTSLPQGNVSLQQLRAVGLEPTELRVIVAKGVNSPRAAFEPIAAEMLYVGTPGVTSADLSTFTYKNRRRPMFPFEQEATY